MRNIRDRITEIRKMRLGDIIHNPRNWRKHPEHQRQAYDALVDEIGWAGVPLVYNSKRTGGITFIDGHMRKEQNPDLVVWVAITDLDDSEADLFLQLFDTIPTLAEPDPEMWAELEAATETASAELQKVLDEMGMKFGVGGEDISVEELWEGMPEFEQDDLSPHRTLKVHFASDEDAQAFGELVGQKITEKTKYLWYPQMERADLESMAYANES